MNTKSNTKPRKCGSYQAKEINIYQITKITKINLINQWKHNKYEYTHFYQYM